MAVLADALRTRARGNLGAASLPRHLRRRATSHRPYKLALRRRPNAKRRRTLEARGLDPSADGAAAYAFAFTVETKNVRVHWCRAARRRPERARHAESTPSRARRLETHLWHAKRFEMRRRWGVVSAERRPGRGRGWRAFDRHARTAAVAHDASHHAAFALVGPRASVDETIRDVVDAAASASASSRAFARGEMALDADIHDDEGVPVAPVMFLRSATDDDAAMAWTPAAAAETAGRILDDAARRRGVATRRVNRATTRVEVCGATARDVVDAILGGGRALDDVDGVFGETCEVPRGVASRARTAGDPRDAARRVSEKTDYSIETVHSDVIAGTGALFSVESSSTTDSDVIAIAAKTPEKAPAPATPSEYAAYRASRRARAFRLNCRDGREASQLDADAKAPVEAKAVSKSNPSMLACCPLTIVRRARGASALARAENPGYTLIAPAGWSLPLWLALIHLGARAAGRTEWGWLARRAGAATFPEDFPDHLAAADAFAQNSSSDDGRTRTRGAVPRGKRAVIGANATTDFETLRRDANDVVLRSRDAWAAATASKTTRARGGRRRQKWSPARSRDGDEDEKLGVGNDANPGKWVRALVRCPWGGRPSAGAPVLAPSTTTSAAGLTRVAPDADRRVAIGVVTSVSAPAASVGLASALVNVDALMKLRAGRKSGGGTRVELRVPSSSPPATVPATIEVAVESAAMDPTWW